MIEQTATPADLERQIVARALKDAQFRAQLIADPIEALASMGALLPAGTRVKVIEQVPNTLYLVLPVRPAGLDAAEELSEAELANVAGGQTNNACPRALGDGW